MGKFMTLHLERQSGSKIQKIETGESPVTQTVPRPRLVGDHGEIFTGSLDRMYGGNLLVVTAHPDDETTMHGMLTFLTQTLHMTPYAVIATNGEGGEDFRNQNKVVSKEFLGRKRREESRRAFEFMGFEGAYYLDLPDGGVSYNSQTILDIRNIILDRRPAAMLRTSVHPQEHNDHINISLMAEKAKWLSATPHLETKRAPHYVPIDLESEMMVISESGYPLVIDTSDYGHRKHDHWKQHETQAPNPYYGIYFPHQSEVRSRSLGRGAQDGEAYRLRDGIETFSVDLEELAKIETGIKRYQPGYVYEQIGPRDRKLLVTGS